MTNDAFNPELSFESNDAFQLSTGKQKRANYTHSEDKMITVKSDVKTDNDCSNVVNHVNHNDVINQTAVHLDTWQKLKQYTDARIALGRAGSSIPTKSLLNFQLDHAEAKDAVLQALDTSHLKQQLSKLLNKPIHLLESNSNLDGLSKSRHLSLKPNSLSSDTQRLQVIEVTSQVTSKSDYLKRPDLGRLLSEESAKTLKWFGEDKSYDVVIVMGDGLSARAIEENAPKLVTELMTLFEAQNWKIAPLVIASGSRVALGDKVAEHLNAKMLVMLIGERPGLSSPDSLGIYYTWKATSSSNDSMRNCISNIRAAGLPIKVAASRLLDIMKKSQQVKLSGVGIKDEQKMPVLDQRKPVIQLL